MEEKKLKELTQKELFEKVIEVLTEVNADTKLIEGMQKRLQVLNNKNLKKQTANQKENEELAQNIIKAIDENGKPMTITELTKIFDLSSQKLSSICNKMIKLDEPTLKKAIVKGKSLFATLTMEFPKVEKKGE